MRIFFVTNNYTPYSGGVTQSITATTNALHKQGHEVFIITLDFLGKKHNDDDCVIRIPCPVKFRYKKNYMAIPWLPTRAIDKLIAQHKPDIIHVHHPFLLGASALRAARTHNIPCIFTYHTLYEEYAHYIPMPRMWMQPIIRSLVQTFCNQVDAIIAPSTHVKKYLQSQGIKTPITVIASPLREVFTQANPVFSRTHPFNLLLVTRFVPEKNIPFVFEVMKLLPDSFHLTIAGYGSDYEKIQQLAYDSFNLSFSRVHFIHKPDEEQLLQLYRTADLFIFPSKTDTQGIVLAESMSQGIPVIAVDGPGQQDIIIDGVNGFIIKNAADAAEKINTLSHNPASYNTLVAGAHATAQKYYADCIVKELLTAYYNLRKNLHL